MWRHMWLFLNTLQISKEDISGSRSQRHLCCSILLRDCRHGYNNKHLHKLHGHIFLLTQQTARQQQEFEEELEWNSARRASLPAHSCRVASKWLWVYVFAFWKSVVLLAEMPIASGAAGRVDVGVDTSTTWTPDGLKKKTKPANRNYDSYLQRWVGSLHMCSNVTGILNVTDSQCSASMVLWLFSEQRIYCVLHIQGTSQDGREGNSTS